MKKKPFILMELFIALSLFTLCLFPFTYGVYHYINKEKDKLIALEQERKAEELFFNICQSLASDHSYGSISGIWKLHPYFPKSNTVTFDLGSLGRETFYWHYHLYSFHEKDRACRTFSCQICFSKKKKLPKKGCDSVTHSFEKSQYGFKFSGAKQKCETKAGAI